MAAVRRSSLAEALETVAASNRVRCRVGLVLAELDAADSESLRTALADMSVSAPMIVRAMSMVGHRLSLDSVKHHRRKLCSCERE
jgi:hypothetical protein